MTVVGVVGRVKQQKLSEDAATTLPMGYLPYRERPNRYIAVVAKTTLPLDVFARASREHLAAIDPTLPIYQVQTLGQLRKANIASDWLNMMLLCTAAIIALALAVVGIYGVIAFSVTERHREIGIRMALGGLRRDVFKLVLSQGMKLVLIGVVLGLVGAFGFGRVLAYFLFQVRPTDWPTLALVPAILSGAATVACALPAFRAAKVDPMAALRNE
jgi:ABC-type antimicrobial peptide transport system permease subunit